MLDANGQANSNKALGCGEGTLKPQIEALVLAHKRLAEDAAEVQAAAASAQDQLQAILALIDCDVRLENKSIDIGWMPGPQSA